ncbi:MAG: 2-oxoglutarate and iron-dependent oxygenase domain-containing protein [Bdellovibrionota bacterium]
MPESVRKVPRLSLRSYLEGNATDQEFFSRQLALGLKEYGFIVLCDHPISETLLNNAYEQARLFFELDLKIKNKYSAQNNGGQRGYTPFGIEHAKDAKVADLKEFWHVGQMLPSGHPYEESYVNNIWPEELPTFKETFTALYKALEDSGRIILQALTSELQVAKDYFDTMTKYGNSILRILHYPPIPPTADPRSIRAAAHEDINLITLLVSATASGLQLKDRDGKWLDVKSKHNDIIVDSGDMLARITNDIYPATTHRVVNPEDANTDRFSIPFFMHPHPKAMLTCIESCRGAGARYEDILAQDFLMERLREIGLIQTSPNR